MLKFSANLTLLFQEVDVLERFQKAAGAGFKGVEIQYVDLSYGSGLTSGSTW